MISIVIPILNEEANIGRLLVHLIENSTPQNISEIIVVDGGSSDNSLEIIQDFLSGRAESRPKDLSTALEGTTIALLKSEKGRARQMNLGAKSATGSILYFLHADSFPPKHFDQFIISEVKKGHLAGCFKMQFDSSHWWLKLAGWLTQFKWRACRGGDQSQFITKDLFNEIGGFNEDFIVYEDNDLINKLYDLKQFMVIQEWITTSARRYSKNGVLKLQKHFWIIHLKKFFGSSALELNRYYQKNIC
jgi:rSAM/selenodomain-associated transferase 2